VKLIVTLRIVSGVSDESLISIIPVWPLGSWGPLFLLAWLTKFKAASIQSADLIEEVFSNMLSRPNVGLGFIRYVSITSSVSVSWPGGINLSPWHFTCEAGGQFRVGTTGQQALFWNILIAPVISKGLIDGYRNVSVSLQLSLRTEEVNIVTRLWAGLPAFDSRQGRGKALFSSSPLPDRLWGPPNLFSLG
jgi:hypothetical protein